MNSNNILADCNILGAKSKSLEIRGKMCCKFLHALEAPGSCLRVGTALPTAPAGDLPGLLSYVAITASNSNVQCLLYILIILTYGKIIANKQEDTSMGHLEHVFGVDGQHCVTHSVSFLFLTFL